MLAKEYSDVEEENKIYVTELAGCLRKAYYDRVSPPMPVPELALLAVAGHGVHMWLETKICQVCKKMEGCECFMESGVFSSIYSEYGVIVVAGFIDVLCKLNGKSIVIEIKTSNNTDVRKDWVRQVRY